MNKKEFKCDMKERIETLERNVSTLTQTVDSLASRIEDVEENVSTVIQTSQGLQSQVSMLQDQVNLKVGKDEVISSINISNEGVRIKGDKIIFDKI